LSMLIGPCWWIFL